MATKTRVEKASIDLWSVYKSPLDSTVAREP
jgi:hypothetical protein